jgi:hypothetical protein
MRAFIASIVVVGALRFGLTVAGFPNNQVKYVSMSAVITLGAVFFAVATRTHLERLKAAFLLIFPYMVIEVTALTYTWISGTPTIFHTPEYSFHTPLWVHTIGHLVGGLTWEPLGLFLLMELVWALTVLAAKIARSM